MPKPTFNKGLVGPDIDAMRHAEVVARLAGYPLLWFTTVTPLRQIPDAERPSIFNDVNNREWKFLSERGKGYRHCALRTREHPRHDKTLVGLHQHSCHWSPDDFPPENLIRAMLGGSDYEWQGRKLVGQNKLVNVALEPNEKTFGIISRVAYMGKERGNGFQWGLKENGRLEKSVREGGQFWTWEQTREILNPRWSQTKGLRDVKAAYAVGQERQPKVYLGARLSPPKAEPEPRPAPAPIMATVTCDLINQSNIPNEKAKPPRLRVVVSNPLVPGPEQPSLFASCEKPVSRLAQFGGGVIPPAVAQEIEARRHWRGLTQEALARHTGISRPQLTNTLRGRFGLSAWAATRLREFLLHQLPPTQRAA